MSLRTKKDKNAKTFTHPLTKPLVTPISIPYTPTNGLSNRHIAMWQSHGFYYESKLTRWEWQRARIFQTVEDLYTQSYVLPFLVPMLENAGANVLLPRERDCNTQEVIVDNDGSLHGKSAYMPVEKGGTVFGSTKEGLIFALEPKTGKVLWKHKVGNSLISTVVPLNGKEVLFTATSGEVGLLKFK